MTNKFIIMGKRFFTLFFAFIMGLTTCMAQDAEQQQRRRPQMPTVEQRVERMTKELNLSQEQVEQLTVLYKEQEKAMREMMQSGEWPSREQMMERMQAQEIVLQAILTEEQYVKYQEMTSRMRGRRGHGRGRHHQE